MLSGLAREPWLLDVYPDVLGGTVKPRERFMGAAGLGTDPSHRQPQGGRSTTGESRRSRSSGIRTVSGTLATAGNLVFHGGPDGTFSAYDAKTLEEVWSITSEPASMRHR